MLVGRKLFTLYLILSSKLNKYDEKGALALGLSYYGTSTGNAILEAARKGSITISSERNYVVAPGSPAASVNFVYDCYGKLVTTYILAVWREIKQVMYIIPFLLGLKELLRWK